MKKSVIKRNGDRVEFNKEKIYIAIMKAMRLGSGLLEKKVAEDISVEIEDEFKKSDEDFTIKRIENMVFKKLNEKGQMLTAKAYEGYRAIQEFKRTSNTTDGEIISLLNGTNYFVAMDNSNKNPVLNSTMRDLVAGEVSKDLTKRKLLPTEIVQAHTTGVLHFHDMDYYMSPMFNCCLIDIEDMLDNGTVINDTLIESPVTLIEISFSLSV